MEQNGIRIYPGSWFVEWEGDYYVYRYNVWPDASLKKYVLDPSNDKDLRDEYGWDFYIKIDRPEKLEQIETKKAQHKNDLYVIKFQNNIYLESLDIVNNRLRIATTTFEDQAPAFNYKKVIEYNRILLKNKNKVSVVKVDRKAEKERVNKPLNNRFQLMDL